LNKKNTLEVTWFDNIKIVSSRKCNDNTKHTCSQGLFAKEPKRPGSKKLKSIHAINLQKTFYLLRYFVRQPVRTQAGPHKLAGLKNGLTEKTCLSFTVLCFC